MKSKIEGYPADVKRGGQFAHMVYWDEFDEIQKTPEAHRDGEEADSNPEEEGRSDKSTEG